MVDSRYSGSRAVWERGPGLFSQRLIARPFAARSYRHYDLGRGVYDRGRGTGRQQNRG